jgi:hypothetical protein
MESAVRAESYSLIIQWDNLAGLKDVPTVGCEENGPDPQRITVKLVATFGWIPIVAASVPRGQKSNGAGEDNVRSHSHTPMGSKPSNISMPQPRFAG